MHGVSNVPPIMLSNGNSYANINPLAVDGSTLINSNASKLSNIAPTLTDTSQLSTYNNIANTHNNSVALAEPTGITPKTIAALATDTLVAGLALSGLAATIMSIVHKVHKPSTSVFVDFPPHIHPVIKFDLPGAPPGTSKMGTFSAFTAHLSSMVHAVSSVPGADEVTGLGLVSNCIDTTTKAGQALNASMVEAKNTQTSITNGLSGGAGSSVPSQSSLVDAAKQAGSSTLGGIANGAERQVKSATGAAQGIISSANNLTSGGVPTSISI